MPDVPATRNELKSIGADDKFIQEQLKAKATLEQARHAWKEKQDAAKRITSQR